MIECRISFARQMEAASILLASQLDASWHNGRFRIPTLRELYCPNIIEASDNQPSAGEHPVPALANLMILENNPRIHKPFLEREFLRGANVDINIPSRSNTMHQKAICKTMLADLSAIREPPGTGKTSTAVDIIMGWLTMMREITQENGMIECLFDDVQKS